jgi:hypothetical protein
VDFTSGVIHELAKPQRIDLRLSTTNPSCTTMENLQRLKMDSMAVVCYMNFGTQGRLREVRLPWERRIDFRRIEKH